jgi:predicted dehydrogenase
MELIAVGGLDAIVVATHELEHASVALAALEAGLHVFVEKPLAATPSEGTRLVDAADRQGLVLMVGFQKLFDPCVEDLRRMLADGSLVPALVRTHNFSHDNSLVQAETLPSYCTTPEYGAGTRDYSDDDRWSDTLRDLGMKVTPDLSDAYRLVLNLACHELAVLLYLFGRPCSVDYVDIWPALRTCITILTWESELRATVETAQTARPWYDEQLSLYASDMTVSLRWPSPFEIGGQSVLDVSSGLPAARQVSIATTSGPASLFRRELEAFHEAVLTGTDPKRTLAVAQATTDVVHMVWTATRPSCGGRPDES